MADEDYARLGCRGCGVPTELFANGNPRKYCGRECMRQQQRRGRCASAQACARCGNGFSADRILKYCSVVCRQRARNRVKADLIAGRACVNCSTPLVGLSLFHKYCSSACGLAYVQKADKPTAYEQRACAKCAAPYWPRHPSAMYCSKACKRRAWFVKTGQADAVEKKRSERLAVMATKAEAAAQARIDKRAAKQVVRDAISQAAEQRRTDRLERAKLAPLVKRERKRRQKHERRARMRSVQVERFDRVAIFERDGWCCQICGVSTPKRLLGSNKQTEPTLDHVVAIANGGAHAAWNSQCACRRCNSAKSDGPPRGQRSLFGETMGGGGSLVETV